MSARRAKTGADGANLELELDAGSISYLDSGGGGAPLVLLHGLLMDAGQWDEVTAELAPDFRCMRPTLPQGAHRKAMREGADLSLRGQVRILVEFLDRLDLHDVTLVFNDWCGAQILIAEQWDERVGRIVFNWPRSVPLKPPAVALTASLTCGKGFLRGGRRTRKSSGDAGQATGASTSWERSK